ncbi:DNA polymerase III subunit alpha [Sphingomonas morindae]|uniref:DNA polymerase III subunit alpha n=1 Tax=Sphingomonas morindae TaxID=1541170 RepID=A0ABY4X627_9SPHN|nr:DNA polymerase III subunit alpha [Sphingomonas morindae]USI72326.1 DNA polymerase III subunit alpha [Sphingomonas morindae]
MHSPFVPLRVFTAFTMLEGAIDPKALAKAAAKRGFPAAAICDRNGLYAAMAFSAAAKAEGVQPIIGALLGVARPAACGGAEEGKPPVIDWLPLFAQDATGYDNLCALVSAAHLDRPIEQDAHVPMAALEGRTDGLIALTGAADGALARLYGEGQAAHGEAYADRLAALFPDRLFIELARRGMAIEEQAEPALVALAYARGWPLVATNPACFLEPDFHGAHDAMLCIADSAYLDSDERRRSLADAWLKPAEAMADAFADLPEAIANTALVATRTAFAAPKRKPILPSLAGDREGEAAMLRRDARAGLEARLRHYQPEGPLEPRFAAYFERLDFETDIIVRMGFPGYFLIVADFIKWAKDHDIPVGPGRGSGAGSVVAWALTITDLDPLRLGLLFERFLNPERVSMPDFDIDFCETRRGEVIRYVQEKYGRDHVAQIITFGKLKARAVLKDTGRVLQMSYGQVDRLAKLVPNHPTDPWTLERALNGVSELHTEVTREPQVRRLFDLAMKLEGFPRHSSTHAAGVVIGDRPLDQLVPLYRDPRSDMPVTQFDMKHVEDAGLVKFDFLGLKTLSVLQKAVQMLARRGIAVDLAALAWDDPAVFELLMSGNTVGVFQLESEGMRRTLSAVRPTCFEDIIALVSLYRPGPMDNIPMFGARKNGREPIEYPHPLLEGILKETYGIFVYQEQVMQAAQVLAGYSLGEADLLRRAMGKKIKAEMDAQRQRFIDGCAKNQIGADKANELFDLIDKFAGYGFNKSHAAAYALVAYQTAWMKAHHKPEFFAASMCYDMAQTDKLAVFVEDMRRMDVACLPPSINQSEAEFSVEPQGEGEGGAVRYALGALKGVGERAMEELVAERRRGGAFASLEDFADRIDPRLLNRRQLESLAAGGAFEPLGLERAAVHGGAETILAHAAAAHEARTSGQGGLFGGPADVPPIRLPGAHWTMAEAMAAEKEAFGFYFSAHPTDRFRHLAQAHGCRSFAQVCAMPPGPPVQVDDRGRRQPQPSVAMAALIEGASWRTAAKSGRRYLFAVCSDATGQYMASCFDDEVAVRIEEIAKAGGCAQLMVELDRREGDETPRVTIRAVRPFEGMTMATRLRLDLWIEAEAAAAPVAALLAPARGGGKGELHIFATGPGGTPVHILAGTDYLFDAELVARVERVPGIASARLAPFEAPRLALVG